MHGFHMTLTYQVFHVVSNLFPYDVHSFFPDFPEVFQRFSPNSHPTGDQMPRWPRRAAARPRLAAAGLLLLRWAVLEDVGSCILQTMENGL